MYATLAVEVRVVSGSISQTDGEEISFFHQFKDSVRNFIRVSYITSTMITLVANSWVLVYRIPPQFRAMAFPEVKMSSYSFPDLSPVGIPKTYSVFSKFGLVWITS